MKKLSTLLMLLLCTFCAAWADTELTPVGGDKDVSITGTSYSIDGTFVAGAGSVSITLTNNNGIKLRTNRASINGDNAIRIDVNSGYKITKIEVQGGSNTAAKPLIIKGIYCDDNTETNYLSSEVTLAAQIYTATFSADINATSNIYITNDGGNTQCVLGLKLTYEQANSGTEFLSLPVISCEPSTGTVTLSGNGDIYYTTDGTDPSVDNATKYESPFVVADGTVVKAKAIGDGETTIDSDIATQQILLSGITIAEPTVKTFNGTVAISCTSPKATIEYSLDGTNYTTYSRAFTLTEDATIYTRAIREACTTSNVAEVAVKAVAANAKTKTIYMGYASFDAPATIDGFSTLAGKAGDNAEGYSLILNKADKSWSSGNAQITISEINETRTAIKLSNGAQNTLKLPEGVKATKLTLYSFINAASGTRDSYWKEINGETISGDILLGAFNDVADRLTNPDVRVFPLDNVEGEITFTNTGEQLCFVIALDVIEPVAGITLNADGYATYCNENAVKVEGATAYTAVVDEAASTMTLTAIENGVIPAKTGVVLVGEGNGEVTFTVTAEDATIGQNDLKASLTTAAYSENVYVLSGSKFVKYTGESLVPNKAYIVMSDNFGVGAAASAMRMVFIGDNPTGIAEAEAAVKATGNAPIYNINGQRVADGAKGILIQNGRKVVVK